MIKIRIASLPLYKSTWSFGPISAVDVHVSTFKIIFSDSTNGSLLNKLFSEQQNNLFDCFCESKIIRSA